MKNPEIWRVVERINEAWVSGKPEALAKCFHAETVLVAPGFAQLLRGREATVQSYREFCANASVTDFQTSQPHIDVFGDAAVVYYRFDITYEMRGDAFTEAGHEILVLKRQDDAWQVIWRTLVPSSQENDT